MVKDNQKQRQTLELKLKVNEDYEALLKDVLENYSENKYPIKRFFDDIRRDRKKIVQ